MSAVSKVNWLFRRLLAMSPGEVLYRVRHKVRQMNYEKRYSKPLSLLDMPVFDTLQEEISSLESRISAILELDNLACPNEPWIFECFDETIDLRKQIRWHSCGKAEWNSSVFAWRIPFQNRDEIGDVRKTFELNRMQFLPRLLLYAKKTDDLNIHNLAESLFYDWIKNNPFLWGVNWASPMECALRALQWTVCAALTTNSVFRTDLVKAALLCVDYVEENFSAYSSANNHLIVEAACCSVINALLGGDARKTRTKACKDILKRELSRQFYTDGTNREHALHYHAFVVDMWLQVNFVYRELGEETLHDELLKKSLRHIQAMQLSEDFFVEYGDSDDAVILDLIGNMNCYYADILAKGKRYFIKENTDSIVSPDNSTEFFDESGYFTYHGHSLYTLFDVAQLGFGKLAAHGHADCLQIIAGFAEKPIFIDSGTYIYNIKKKLRDYFRSTPAHNTLTYNKDSQSVMQGPFLWSKKAQIIKKNRWENEVEIHVSGAHDGYSPHIHHRKLVLHKASQSLVIKDNFPEEFTLHFILHPDRKIKLITEHLYEIDDGFAFFYSSGEVSLEKVKVSFSFLSDVETYAFCIQSRENAVSILSQDKTYVSELII